MTDCIHLGLTSIVGAAALLAIPLKFMCGVASSQHDGVYYVWEATPAG